MALIKCPECGNMVSNIAKACIHCGYPLNQEELLRDKNYNIILIEVGNSKNPIWHYLAENYEMSYNDGLRIFNNLPYTLFENVPVDEAQSIYNQIISFGGIAKLEEYTAPEYKEELRCPRCNSNMVTTGSRGYSSVWGFIGSGSTVNRCGKCGYTWKP